MGVKSNQERSKEIAKLIRDWIAERDTDGDYDKWVQTAGPTAFKGVKRKELAAALGVSTTSLNVNEANQELRNAEFRWCRDYLQKQDDSKAASAELRRARDGAKRAQKRANSLEGNNSELKAENRILRARLAKWETVEKVLLETARAPRVAFTDE
jgi:hypothetical protein